MAEHLFGRRVPTDFAHVEKYPAKKLGIGAPLKVNITLPFTADMKARYNQNGYNACVGASLAQMQAFNNTQKGRTVIRYDFLWLWNEAKAIDEWNDTNPGDNNGTSLRAGLDVLRQNGLVRCNRLGGPKKNATPNPDDGIQSNYWCKSVDEMRSVLSQGVMVAMATDFTRAMENPKLVDGRYRMPETTDFRDVAGGHAWGIYGALDDRQCFLMPNTWNLDWPDPSGQQLFCEVPYTLIDMLLKHDGEAAVAIDKRTAALLGLEEIKPSR